MFWERVKIHTHEGVKDAIAPTIISASRSTDIPAFHSEWLINRLRAGYVRWINPFNRREQFISFEKARFFVFWTKNALPLLKHLPEIDRLGITYYFNYTINDYESERLEPNLPPLSNRIKTFKSLSDKIGMESVIWRFDPLILTESIDVELLLLKIRKVGDELFRYTNRLVFSYVDIEEYKNVKKNLINQGIKYSAFNEKSMVTIAKRICDYNSTWNLKIATCGERIDLHHLGIQHNKCVDGNLLLNLCGQGRSIDNLYNNKPHKQLSMFDEHQETDIHLKDGGQRKDCQCMPSKDIGQYNTCGHLCSYCYANYSPKIVKNNLRRINFSNDSIL